MPTGLWLRDPRDQKRKPFRPSFLLPALRVMTARAAGPCPRTPGAQSSTPRPGWVACLASCRIGLHGDCTASARPGSRHCSMTRCDSLRAGTGTLADTAERIHLIHADAREFLARPDDRPDAVYMDPMFPNAARAPPRCARSCCGCGAGRRRSGCRGAPQHGTTPTRERVIVKRPDHAPPGD